MRQQETIYRATTTGTLTLKVRHMCASTQTPTVNPSFLTQSVCGTLCPSMSASCHLTASRLV